MQLHGGNERWHVKGDAFATGRFRTGQSVVRRSQARATSLPLLPLPVPIRIRQILMLPRISPRCPSRSAMAGAYPSRALCDPLFRLSSVIANCVLYVHRSVLRPAGCITKYACFSIPPRTHVTWVGRSFETASSSTADNFPSERRSCPSNQTGNYSVVMSKIHDSGKQNGSSKGEKAEIPDSVITVHTSIAHYARVMCLHD
ncbi:hypothetical protein ALC62_03588 [Cyphomyrmex costatus]|uniref:Uncharacterized protein n=1 Tax=Cyphomyrmex costatus TaxID=456900 RepID=A0A151IL57_9HYME|nr:hypothetical protein ALC62_03588 [Cyphomyrmex costatus]